MLAFAIGIIGFLSAPWILHVLNTPAESVDMAITYTRIIFAGMPFLYGYNYIMTVMRGAGDSKTPFYFLIVSVVLDVLLNPLFIFGWGPIPAMGIGGSATATLIAQGISFVLILIYLYRVKYFCALHLQSFTYLDLIGRLFGP